MRILLLGKGGQVGWELQRSLAPLGELIAFGRSEVDLEDVDGLRQTIRNTQPAVIVNAAAYTAVDKAESEPERAHRVNAEAVGVLADEAARLDARFVHYSTDYVFDGAKTGAYTEADTANPINVYGQTKLAGERLVYQSGCRHLVLRTSWVFSARGNNLVRTVLHMARESENLRVVCDQVGAPTSAALIADVTAHCLSHMLADAGDPERLSGVYHLAANGETSRHGCASYVIDRALERGVSLKARPDRVKPIATAEYPLPARRPLNSRLDTWKLRTAFQLSLPDWQTQVDRVVGEVIAQGAR